MNTTHPRGTICVERKVCGQVMWLALANQNAYREWVGCFSTL